MISPEHCRLQMVCMSASRYMYRYPGSIEVSIPTGIPEVLQWNIYRYLVRSGTQQGAQMEKIRSDTAVAAPKFYFKFMQSGPVDPGGILN